MASHEYVKNDVIHSTSPERVLRVDLASEVLQDSDVLSDNDAHLGNSESNKDDTIISTQDESASADQTIICVICLELVDEPAVALPCQHNHFHFSCLGTWLQQNRLCPLCKHEVRSIRYHDCKSQSTNVFHLPLLHPSQPSQGQQHQRVQPRLRHRSHHARGTSVPVTEDRDLRFRRNVYEHQLYCLYIGNNRISRYRNVTPALIRSDPTILPRAKRWIRRELRALDPFEQYSTSSHSATAMNRSNQFRNNEFLLEYIVAILRHIDLKGSAGQAELLLREHLGSGCARLFIHELENWLRSPFERLEDWDSYVQYPEPAQI